MRSILSIDYPSILWWCLAYSSIMSPQLSSLRMVEPLFITLELISSDFSKIPWFLRSYSTLSVSSYMFSELFGRIAGTIIVIAGGRIKFASFSKIVVNTIFSLFYSLFFGDIFVFGGVGREFSFISYELSYYSYDRLNAIEY